MWKFTLWGRSCQLADRSIYLNEMWLSSISLNIYYFLFCTINSDNFTRHFASEWVAHTQREKEEKTNQFPSREEKERLHELVEIYDGKKKKTSREKRNASNDMQKEKGCCCFCYWRVQAASSCAVQNTAWSNHILCNFLIFCIFFVICVKFRVISWRGQISRLTANLSLNLSWEENVQNRTLNIRNRLIGALKENTHTSNNS